MFFKTLGNTLAETPRRQHAGQKNTPHAIVMPHTFWVSLCVLPGLLLAAACSKESSCQQLATCVVNDASISPADNRPLHPEAGPGSDDGGVTEAGLDSSAPRDASDQRDADASRPNQARDASALDTSSPDKSAPAVMITSLLPVDDNTEPVDGSIVIESDAGRTLLMCQTGICTPTCSSLQQNGADIDIGCEAELPRCLDENTALATSDAGASSARADTSELDDARCVECTADADCAAGFCHDFECIECLPQNVTSEKSGCTEPTSVCLVGEEAKDNSCVACINDLDCTSAEHAVCSADFSCTSCDTDSECSRFDQTPICHALSGSCVACTSDTHCVDPALAQCNLSTNSCVPCASDTQCAGITGATTCDIANGLCVECTPQNEESCGANSCDPKTFQCSDTPRGSRQLCETCSADSECEEAPNARCVTMDFDGEPRPGGYCLRLSSAGCDQPYSIGLDRVSLSGAATATFCGVNPGTELIPAVTCEAVRDLLSGKGCAVDADCGAGQGGLCRKVGVVEERCTYACGDGLECPPNRECDAPTSPYCK